MAVIGNFQMLEAGGFAGEIRTLTLILKGVVFRPGNGRSGADFVVSAGGVDFGSAWLDEREPGLRRFRVELDDLSFCDTAQAILQEGPDGWQLVWARHRSAGA